MRKLIVLILILALAGCIPPGRRSGPSRPGQASRPAKPSGRPAAPELSGAELRQCLADLDEKGVRYTPMPNQVMNGGCNQIGTVRVSAAGLPLTGAGPMKCRVALQFDKWVNDAVQKAAEVWLETSVTRIESFGTYSCRPINNREGARLSEHGRANAIDISAFVMADGRRITVRDGWNGTDQGARDFLRAVHKAACRRFSIVIGPDANALHHDHLHFDLGGNGPYCH
jgi:hypothetical protein